MTGYSTSMLDHLNLGVSDIVRSRAFYTATLASIGIEELLDIEPERAEADSRMIGYGKGRKPFFWIIDDSTVGENTHLAFAVETRAEVRAFYKAAMNSGGADNGAPGPRPAYHENYYGAFVLDPDGINVEAVCHRS